MTDNTDKIQSSEKSWQFQKGASGNPEGRPKGSRNKTTLTIQALLEGEAEAITRMVIEAAKKGDMAAIKLVLERLLPPRKDAPVSFTLPPIHTPEDIAAGIASILQAVSDGELTPQEGQSVAALLELQRKSIETALLARKLETLHTLLQSRP